MGKAKIGDTVKVHYTGKLEDGTVFDTSVERGPLEFKIGEGQVIQGFEDAVIGMNPGEEKTVEIPADEAYGQRNEEMVADIGRDQFPEYLSPEVGQQFQIRQQNGQIILVTVTEISEDTVTLDANHPLAGKDLTFEIQLLEIE